MDILLNFVDSVNDIIGNSFLKPWLIILLLILFVFALFLFLSMKLGNLSQNVEKKITYQYDKIFYLWSVFYHDHVEKLSSNPALIVLKSIISSGKSKYIPNRKAIQDTIFKIENKLGTKVIPDDEWNLLKKLFRKYKTRKFFSALLKTIIVLIILFLLILLMCIILKK